MAVRLNMSPALLRSHIHKSTRNDCKPKTHTTRRNKRLPTSGCTFSFTPAGGALVRSFIRQQIQSFIALVF